MGKTTSNLRYAVDVVLLAQLKGTAETVTSFELRINENKLMRIKQ